MFLGRTALQEWRKEKGAEEEAPLWYSTNRSLCDPGDPGLARERQGVGVLSGVRLTLQRRCE